MREKTVLRGIAVALAAVGMLAFGLAGTAGAATGIWSLGEGAGTWDTTATNWSGVTGTPWDSTNGPTNSATFNTDNNVANVSGAVYAGSLNFGATGNTVNVSTGSLNINGGSLDFGVANSALVISGAGSMTMNADGGKNINLNSGSGQSITVQGGASLTLNVASSGGTIYMGSSSASAPNTLTVTGNGSTFTNGNASYGANIWLAGSNSQIIVSDGATFSSPWKSIYVGGRWGNNTNNSLSVTGGSQLTTGNVIGLQSASGSNSTYMSLLISGGSTASSLGGNISFSNGTNNNTATVTGSNSVWNLRTGNLRLGDNATAQNNTMNVWDGGAMTNVGSVLMGGVNNNFNLGNGLAVSTATVNTFTLATTGAKLNIENGRLIAGLAGTLVSGSGQVELLGDAFISTGVAAAISTAISGTGSLTKEDIGELTLSSAAISYTGDTTVLGGILTVSNAVLADAADVYIAGGKLNLTSGLADTINALFINGVQQGIGTYGSTASSATYQDDNYFSGTGVLNVTVPEPATMSLLVLGGLAMLGRKRRAA